MNIKFLDWDSNFFGKKIGSIDLTPNFWDELDHIFKMGKDGHFELVYGFLNVKDKQTMIHESLKNDYQTTNVIYRKKLSNNLAIMDAHIRIADPISDASSLKDMALQAGHSSRFVKDLQLGLNAGQKLYDTWIENSLNKNIAHEVLVYDKDGISGFITLKYNDNHTEVGLIAVDARFRNQNIGSKLLEAAEVYGQQHQCEYIKVGTQIENANACRFYERNHFVSESYSQIYHFWL
jgi:dTDP-4-amino-4,6-dideoxy-D-galactose acyltransferase